MRSRRQEKQNLDDFLTMKMEMQNNTKFIVKTRKKQRKLPDKFFNQSSCPHTFPRPSSASADASMDTPKQLSTVCQRFSASSARYLRSISGASAQIWTQDGSKEFEKAAEKLREPSRSAKTTKVDDSKLKHRNYTSQLSKQYLQ